MKLLIVESPSKAKTISKYLGGEYEVRASVGHIRDLPKSNKKAIDIEHGFIPHYEISPGKEKVVKELTELSRKANTVILATDPDREGEAIAWHIKEACHLTHAKRVTYTEITEKAIRKALESPRSINMHVKEAQEARRVLDRLVGYDLSGLIWKKVRYGLSAGRVQSPALRIVMEREREIRAFIPETFYRIFAETQTQGKAAESKKHTILLECVEEPRDKKLADTIVARGINNPWFVKDVTSREVKRSPKAPFITSTLQQAASSRLGFAPSRTMSIAQKLYEKGLITYMRTDSTTLSVDAVAEIVETITKEFGKEHVETRQFKTKSKNAQEAHEAVRPTHADTRYGGTTDDEKKLYSLIWARTVASQMKDAVVIQTKIIANISDQEIPNFTINGQVIKEPHFMLVDDDHDDKNVILPPVSVGDPLTLIACNAVEKQTEPPSRYTEAGLIKELEKREIGRPSTYASIITTIVERGYVEKVNKSLHPTDTGEVVISFLEKEFEHYIGDTFTAEMEDKLDQIAEGKQTYLQMLTEFYGPFLAQVKEKDKLEKQTNLGIAPPEMVCPLCASGMVVKLAKNGRFYSCDKFPDCVGARTLEGHVMEGPKSTGRTCPKCNDGDLMEREGKFGKFIACANYPKCKYIEQDEEERKKRSTGVTCGKCEDGVMEERRGRFGIFYACSNYPDCKHAIKTKPTGNICPLDNELMMDGTKTIPERCSNKLCANHNPHKIEKK